MQQYNYSMTITKLVTLISILFLSISCVDYFKKDDVVFKFNYELDELKISTASGAGESVFSRVLKISEEEFSIIDNCNTPASSTYSESFLKYAILSFNEVEFSYNKDYPCQFIYRVGAESSIKILIAPRVIEE